MSEVYSSQTAAEQDAPRQITPPSPEALAAAAQAEATYWQQRYFALQNDNRAVQILLQNQPGDSVYDKIKRLDDEVAFFRRHNNEIRFALQDFYGKRTLRGVMRAIAILLNGQEADRVRHIDTCHVCKGWEEFGASVRKAVGKAINMNEFISPEGGC